MSGEIAENFDPTQLLVLVDVANLVDRQRVPAKKWLSHLDSMLETIETIAPQAIVVKFADRHNLAKYLSPESPGFRELERRNDLDYHDPDKIYLVHYADKPILEAASRTNGIVISNDQFTEHVDLLPLVHKKFSVRHQRRGFRGTHVFSECHDGISLGDWWAEVGGAVQSDSSETLDLHNYRVRQLVNELTFEWTSEQLTYNPFVPRFPPVAVPRRSEEPDRDDSDAPHAHEIVPIRRRSPVRVVLRADEVGARRDLLGERVAVVGTFAVYGGAVHIEWYLGYDPVRLFGEVSMDDAPAVGFARVVGTLSTVDGQVVLDIDGSEGVGEISYGEILARRHDVGMTPVRPGPWVMPKTRVLLSVFAGRRRTPAEHLSAVGDTRSDEASRPEPVRDNRPRTPVGTPPVHPPYEAISSPHGEADRGVVEHSAGPGDPTPQGARSFEGQSPTEVQDQGQPSSRRILWFIAGASVLALVVAFVR